VADERGLPSEDELREALDRVSVVDILLNAASAVASVGFRRVSPEALDLAQARLAIESLRALEPVLREGGVDETIVRDLEQARANLQLAYAKAVSDGVASADTSQPQPENETDGVEAETRQTVDEEPG
jgi:hypothetical protein